MLGGLTSVLPFNFSILMMERSDVGSSLNHESETDLNMEIENAVGPNESVPGEGIEKAVDIVPGENGSSAGDLNIAPQLTNCSDETRSTVTERLVPLLARNQLGGILLIPSVMICRNVLELLCLHLHVQNQQDLSLTPCVWRILTTLTFSVCSER